MALREPLLAASEIQGNVIPGFNTTHMHLLGLKITGADPTGARAWLAGTRADVAASTVAALAEVRRERRAALATGDERPPTPRTWVNVTLSMRALRLLKGDAEADTIIDAWFKNGMWSVAESLGEPAGSVGTWEIGSSEDETPDILAILGDDNYERLLDKVIELKELAQLHRLVPDQLDQPGDRLDGDVEHFGFKDGVSVPAVRGRISEDGDDFLYKRYLVEDDRLHDLYARPGQILVWPGQAVFGYQEQSTVDARRPGPTVRGGASWMQEGSFLVLRRLKQDVSAFRAFVAEQAAATGISEDELAAKIVGRKKDGTPLIDSGPLTAAPALDDSTQRFANNHFAFRTATPEVQFRDDKGEMKTIGASAADPDGNRCPHAAHIRKVNPRDATTDKGSPAITLKLQVLRRGIPYGGPYPGDRVPDPESERRGLLFMAYTTRLREPLETIGAAWMNRTNAPEADGTGVDLLVGQSPHPGQELSAAYPRLAQPVRATNGNGWVTSTGGGFFFSPSVSELAGMAV